MSILTCTNVRPSNEVVTIDRTLMTGDELAEYKAAHPEYANLPNTDVAFYKNPPKFSFTFNCSGGTGCLRFFITEYTNVRTGKKLTSHTPRFSKYTAGTEYNNGDTISYAAGTYNKYTDNGQDWQYQRTFYQSDKSALGKGDTEPLYDMKFCQGKIAYESGEYKISTGITNLRNALYLYEPKSNDGTIDYDHVHMNYYGKTYTFDDGTKVTFTGNTLKSCYLIGGAVIEINGERRLIQDYDKKTGVLTLKSNFTNKVTTGDKFVIYTNYFIDKPHYVMNRSKPKMEMSVNIIHSNKKDYNKNTYSVNYNAVNSKNQNYFKTTISYTGDKPMTVIENVLGTRSYSIGSIHCECNYKQANRNQADYSGLKYFQYSLYYSDDKGNIGELCKQSEDIYDDSVSYDFYVPFINQSYYVVLKIVTQENAVYEQQKLIHFYANTNSDGNYLSMPIEDKSFKTELSSNKSYIAIKWTWNADVHGRYVVYRRYKLGSDWSDWNIIMATSTFSKNKGEKARVVDYTVGSNMEYQYMIQYTEISEDIISEGTNTYTATNNITYYAPYITDNVKYSWSETIITSLKPKTSAWKENAYSPIETWNFATIPDSNDIISNLGINLYDGTNGMPLLTRINKEYESSSFSLDLLQLKCDSGEVADDISLVKKWVKFINGDNDFMLKNPKGDVWIIEVTGAPSRAYEYGTDIMVTTIKYDWVQVADTDKTAIA